MRGRNGGVGLLLTLLAASGLSAQQSHVLVITGAGGEPKYTQQFHEWATKLTAAAGKQGVLAENIVYLGEQTELGGGMAGRSTREAVQKAFADLATRSRPGDNVLIVLIGHGSAAAGTARFNLPGPDLTAVEYQKLLEPLTARKIGFVNTASASGAFVAPLSAPGRTLVTATRSGNEGNETVFARFFVDAYTGAGADTDKDNKVSLLEAYTFAAREVERWYGEQNRLLTEHAQLDDDGDGKGAAKPDGRTGDGMVARTLVLGGTPAAVASEPRTQGAVRRKEAAGRKSRDAAQHEEPAWTPPSTSASWSGCWSNWREKVNRSGKRRAANDDSSQPPSRFRFRFRFRFRVSFRADGVQCAGR